MSTASLAIAVPTASTLVALSLPKVTFTSPTFSLSGALKQMGMVRAFDGTSADFSAMSPLPLYVQDLVQKAMVSMVETGVEAAAATAVITADAGAPREGGAPTPIPTCATSSPTAVLCSTMRTSQRGKIGRPIALRKGKTAPPCKTCAVAQTSPMLVVCRSKLDAFGGADRAQSTAASKHAFRFAPPARYVRPLSLSCVALEPCTATNMSAGHTRV